MRPFAQAIERLDTIPGVGRRAAEQSVAELGVDMSRFPTAVHAASWTRCALAGAVPVVVSGLGDRAAGTQLATPTTATPGRP